MIDESYRRRSNSPSIVFTEKLRRRWERMTSLRRRRVPIMPPQQPPIAAGSLSKPLCSIRVPLYFLRLTGLFPNVSSKGYLASKSLARTESILAIGNMRRLSQASSFKRASTGTGRSSSLFGGESGRCGENTDDYGNRDGKFGHRELHSRVEKCAVGTPPQGVQCEEQQPVLLLLLTLPVRHLRGLCRP
jgi:hypothetical protein